MGNLQGGFGYWRVIVFLWSLLKKTIHMATISPSDHALNNTKRDEFVNKLKNMSTADYHGLHNQGETCYLNSVLQVFFMTKDFREAIERGCGDSFLGTIDLQLKQLFDDLNSHKLVTDPANIAETLGIKNVFEQRDAAEYFEKILIMASPDVSGVFKGQLRHRTTCCECGKQSDVDSPFWTLPLPVDDVMSAFNTFFKTSEVCGRNKMYCDECEIKTDATIKCLIQHYPDILTLLLKRFEFDYYSMSYVKIHRDVGVPQTLNIKCNTYELYAVVDHSGSLRGGHYTTTIKSYDNGKWYEFNDSHVRLAPIQLFEANCNTRSSYAYLLMYQKKKLQAPYLQTIEGANHNYLAEESEDVLRRNYLTVNSENQYDHDSDTGMERGKKGPDIEENEGDNNNLRDQDDNIFDMREQEQENGSGASSHSLDLKQKCVGKYNYHGESSKVEHRQQGVRQLTFYDLYKCSLSKEKTGTENDQSSLHISKIADSMGDSKGNSAVTDLESLIPTMNCLKLNEDAVANNGNNDLLAETNKNVCKPNQNSTERQSNQDIAKNEKRIPAAENIDYISESLNENNRPSNRGIQLKVNNMLRERNKKGLSDASKRHGEDLAEFKDYPAVHDFLGTSETYSLVTKLKTKRKCMCVKPYPHPVFDRVGNYLCYFCHLAHGHRS